MRTIEDIIEAAGGLKKVARRLPAKVRPDGSKPDREWAVRKWPKTGVPERHWPLLMRMVDALTAEDLFAANQRARRRAKRAANAPEAADERLSA